MLIFTKYHCITAIRKPQHSLWLNNQNERKELVIRYSEDEGVNWSTPKVIYQGEAAYSSMTQLSNGDIGIFYEADNYTSNIFKSLSIDWIISSE